MNKRLFRTLWVFYDTRMLKCHFYLLFRENDIIHQIICFEDNEFMPTLQEVSELIIDIKIKNPNWELITDGGI